MRKLFLLGLILTINLAACSEDSPTDPGSTTAPTPPYEGKGSLMGYWVSEDGTIAIDENVVIVNGERKETDFRISPWNPNGSDHLWISVKNPYNAGGWMIMDSWGGPPGVYIFDCEYDGETVQRTFHRR